MITKYRVYTLTKTRTLWLTKTLTKTYTYTQSGTTKTIIYTKTSTIPVTYTYTTTSTIPITYTYTKTSTIPITYTYTSTVTSTYTKGGTTYTTTYTFPVTTTYTSTKTIVSTSVSYRYHTITKTVWKKTTIIKKVPTTITKKVPGKPTTVTKTVTKYIYVGGGGPYGGSVLGNVTVITPEGGKPIQDVRPGDLVLTEEGFKEVKEVKAIPVSNLYRIELEDGKMLLADDAQPVVTIEGIKRVGELRIGDELVTLNGTSKIIGIKRHDLEAVVYDLVFDKPLNYYANEILVNDLKSGVILLTWPYSEFIFIRGW